jgi:hypothetical protein
MSADELRKAVALAREEWQSETTGPFRHAAQRHLAVADWLEDIATRHAADPEPIELMLHWDEECPTGECVDGNGHESIVCKGCWPSWEGMDGHTLYPCSETRAALKVARAYLGTSDRSRPEGSGNPGVTGAQPDEPASQAGRPVAGGAA